MGRMDASSELGDTEYILKASATRLVTDRRRGISAEMETYIQGQEVRLTKIHETVRSVEKFGWVASR